MKTPSFSTPSKSRDTHETTNVLGEKEVDLVDPFVSETTLIMLQVCSDYRIYGPRRLTTSVIIIVV